MIDIDTIEVYYQYFYSKKYKEKYKFRRSKTTKSVCESFLKLVDKEYSLHCVADIFLWDYFLFQFNYWHELTLGAYFDKLNISFVVGKKAFDRWKNRDREFDWQMESYPIIKEYGVYKKDLFTNRKREKIVNDYDASTAIRKQYHNTDRGFAVCIEFTTLYDPKDQSCQDCQFKNDCKELLRVNYPQLYKNRQIAEI